MLYMLRARSAPRQMSVGASLPVRGRGILDAGPSHRVTDRLPPASSRQESLPTSAPITRPRRQHGIATARELRSPSVTDAFALVAPVRE